MNDKKNNQIMHVGKHLLSNYKTSNKNNVLLPFYHKNVIMSFLKRKKLLLSALLLTFFANIMPVFAVDKIEGGDITIESLGTIISGIATKIQVFGIILSFVALVVFVIQFIIGDDETKQRKKKTILYTLGGVGLLILIPSLINIIITTLDS